MFALLPMENLGVLYSGVQMRQRDTRQSTYKLVGGIGFVLGTQLPTISSLMPSARRTKSRWHGRE